VFALTIGIYNDEFNNELQEFPDAVVHVRLSASAELNEYDL
jgi:hypothetical protein